MMRQSTIKRLERLEGASPVNSGKFHTILADSEEELAVKRADLMGSPAWNDGDNLIGLLFVDAGFNDSLVVRQA